MHNLDMIKYIYIIPEIMRKLKYIIPEVIVRTYVRFITKKAKERRSEKKKKQNTKISTKKKRNKINCFYRRPTQYRIVY